MVSDYTTSKMVTWSQAKPVFTYTVPRKYMRQWTLGVEATTASVNYTSWIPCNFAKANAASMGFWHFCSYDASGVAGRAIVGKLRMWVTFRNKL